MSIFRRDLMMLSAQQHGVSYQEHGYIADGLVFHLDGIDKGANEGAWTDLVSGIIYTPDGDTRFNYDSVVGSLTSNDGINITDKEATIEATWKKNNNEDKAFTFYNQKIQGNIINGIGVKGLHLSNTNPRISYSPPINLRVSTEPHSVSSNANLALLDRDTLLNRTTGDYFYPSTSNSAVNRPDITLYSLRIYDRLLTENEMRHNQEVDYDRFIKDIGKTIIVTSSTDTVDLTINEVKKTYAVTPNVPSKIVIEEQITNLNNLCKSQDNITSFDMSNLTINTIHQFNSPFNQCTKLKEFIAPCSKTLNNNLLYFFSGCAQLEYVDFSLIETMNTNSWSYAFSGCSSLKHIKFKKLLSRSQIDFSYCPLTHESALSIINALGEQATAITIKFKATTYETLTEEDIAIATAKGWSVVSA